jgi:hypothetical protein
MPCSTDSSGLVDTLGVVLGLWSGFLFTLKAFQQTDSCLEFTMDRRPTPAAKHLKKKTINSQQSGQGKKKESSQRHALF